MYRIVADPNIRTDEDAVFFPPREYFRVVIPHMGSTTVGIAEFANVGIENLVVRNGVVGWLAQLQHAGPLRHSPTVVSPRNTSSTGYIDITFSRACAEHAQCALCD
jgi:hypothetical protein